MSQCRTKVFSGIRMSAPPHQAVVSLSQCLTKVSPGIRMSAPLTPGMEAVVSMSQCLTKVSPGIRMSAPPHPKYGGGCLNVSPRSLLGSGCQPSSHPGMDSHFVGFFFLTDHGGAVGAGLKSLSCLTASGTGRRVSRALGSAEPRGTGSACFSKVSEPSVPRTFMES